MTRKIVGITCSSSEASPGENARQYLNTAYVMAVLNAGGVPLIIPNVVDEELVECYLGSIDGLMLSGGVDVDPKYFGEKHHPQLGTVDASRDSTELALLKRALERDMPIFGICRGIQTLNVALGGTLYQHIPDQAPSSIHHQQSDIEVARNQFSHSIRIEGGSRLKSIVGKDEMLTNSFHHQALKSVAPGLVVTAYAPDGVIEAVEAPDRKYLVAVQFHPEETAPHDVYSHRLFEAFVQAL
jgi:putative glutamine amidotransferase